MKYTVTLEANHLVKLLVVLDHTIQFLKEQGLDEQTKDLLQIVESLHPNNCKLEYVSEND